MYVMVLQRMFALLINSIRLLTDLSLHPERNYVLHCTHVSETLVIFTRSCTHKHTHTHARRRGRGYFTISPGVCIQEPSSRTSKRVTFSRAAGSGFCIQARLKWLNKHRRNLVLPPLTYKYHIKYFVFIHKNRPGKMPP